MEIKSKDPNQPSYNSHRALRKFKSKKKQAKRIIHSKNFIENQKECLKILRNSDKTNKRDKLIYDTYKKIVDCVQNNKIPEEALERFPELKEIKEEYKNYFYWVFIDWLIWELNLSPHMFLISSAKNQGKTRQTNHLIKQALKDDPENNGFFYIRNHKEEMLALKNQFMEENECPVFLGDNLTIFHKFIKKKKEKGKKVAVPCGYAAYISGSGLEVKQGPSYPYIRKIIWDECNTTGGQFDFQLSDVRRFIVFCSSVIRNKKGVKTYMFFNKLRNRQGTTENVILKAFGISEDLRSKYVVFQNPRNKDKSTELLFLDITECHSVIGVESQEGVALINQQLADDLLSNKPRSNVVKLVGAAVFAGARPEISIVFRHKEQDLILYLGSYYIPQEGFDYVCLIETYNPTNHYFYKPFTESVSIYNKYNLRNDKDKIKLPLIDPSLYEVRIMELYNIARSGKIFFSDEFSSEVFNDLLDKWDKRHKIRWGEYYF